MEDNFFEECKAVLKEKSEKYGEEWKSRNSTVCTNMGLYLMAEEHVKELHDILQEGEIVGSMDTVRAKRLCVHITNRMMMIHQRIESGIEPLFSTSKTISKEE